MAQRQILAVFGFSGSGKTVLCQQLGLRQVEPLAGMDDNHSAVSSNLLHNIAQQVEVIRNSVADQEEEVQVQVVLCCRQDQQVVSEQLAHELNNLAQHVTVLQVRPENGGNQTWRVVASTASPNMNNTVVESPNELRVLLFGQPEHD